MIAADNEDSTVLLVACLGPFVELGCTIDLKWTLGLRFKYSTILHM